MPCCDDDREDLSHASKPYRRVLLVVVVLNLGMGVAEMASGWLGLSYALRADALDFLGDGLITGLGLAAASRGQQWRTRAAFVQGVFLALLAVGIIAAALYRAFSHVVPESSLMTGVGLVALAVNVLCALILIPHRHGDAGVRAVWLFSRNDALGNLAVAVAGLLVWWLGTGWPDIVTAIVIASLFLHSAVEILKTARRELGSLKESSAKCN